MEIYFPEDVRFIAVNDGVDSTVESSNDFNPIRNWANEFSRQGYQPQGPGAVMKKAEQERAAGRQTALRLPESDDANTLVPDEDTAPVVKRIFLPLRRWKRPSADRHHPHAKEQVVNPSNAYYRKTGKAIGDWTHQTPACGLPTASPAFLNTSNPTLGHWKASAPLRSPTKTSSVWSALSERFV